MGTTKIEWAEKTWNPVTGCTKIATGCTHCYAETLCRRFWKQWDRKSPPNHFEVKLHPDRLNQPLGWKKPCRVFVCSMGDLFHEDVPLGFVDRVITHMRIANQHTYQILTKRPRRILEYLDYDVRRRGARLWWPEHIQFGVSVSTQADADRMLPELLRTPAAVRFVSMEPMIGPIEIEQFIAQWRCPDCHDWQHTSTYCDCCDTEQWENIEAAEKRGLDWIIIGCESGPNRRPMELEWAIDLVSQGDAAGVPVCVKQIEVNGKVSHDPAEWDPVLQVREYPDVEQQRQGDQR